MSEPIQWKWMLISILMFVVVQVVLNVVFTVFGVLTLGFGFILFIIVKPVTYFIGGLATGYLSPGVTLREPAIGAVVVAVGGTIFDATRASAGRVLWMIIAGVIAFVVALAGARVGEQMQRERN